MQADASITETTARQAPQEAAGGASPAAAESLTALTDISLEQAVAAGGLLAAAVLVAWVVHAVFFRLANRLVRRPGPVDAEAVRRLRGPARLLLLVAAVQIVAPGLDGVLGPYAGIFRHALTIAMIIAAAWLLGRLIETALRILLGRYDVSAADNLQARQVHTQIVVIRRILVITIGVIAAGAILMTFPAARQVGTSILASAGIAGIAVGLAARPVIENLLAGLQIAFTQPIRLDDVVIMDGEWGRVEEITATFVVVRIWDQRRLIVPLSKIISQSFQNWTRTSADLLGTVFVHTDYTVDVKQVRAWLQDWTKDHPKWDQRVCVLQVTEAGPRTMQLRALVSAASSGDAWDLRCDLREAIVDYIQRTFPDALPQVRAVSLDAGAAAAEEGAEPVEEG